MRAKKKYEELSSKLKNIIRWMTKKSHYYDKKHMKIKFCLDGEFPLNKMIEIPGVRTAVISVFHENSK